MQFLKKINLKGNYMSKKIVAAFIVSLILSSHSYGGYSCHELINENGEYGPSIVKLDVLKKDVDLLQSLWDIFYYDDVSFIKYQYWIDAGGGYHMVQFTGITNSLVDGAPELKNLNLFCKDDNFQVEGGL